jgi:hypothetical protein
MPKYHSHKLSPFFEGLARTFDLAGLFDKISPPLPDSTNPLADDWRVISQDYNKSITIINGNTNDELELPTGK